MEDANERLKKRLRTIYSETTIDHILHPRNIASIAHPDGLAERANEDGESIKIWLRIHDGIVQQAAFWTNGCAATIACGSMATELIQRRTVNEALTLTAQDIAEALVDLPPGNFHCAELVASAVKDALMDYLTFRRQPWRRWYRP